MLTSMPCSQVNQLASCLARELVKGDACLMHVSSSGSSSSAHPADDLLANWPGQGLNNPRYSWDAWAKVSSMLTMMSPPAAGGCTQLARSQALHPVTVIPTPQHHTMQGRVVATASCHAPHVLPPRSWGICLQPIHATPPSDTSASTSPAVVVACPSLCHRRCTCPPATANPHRPALSPTAATATAALPAAVPQATARAAAPAAATGHAPRMQCTPVFWVGD